LREVVGIIDSKNYSKIDLTIVTGESVTSLYQKFSDSIEQKFENDPYDKLLYQS